MQIGVIACFLWNFIAELSQLGAILSGVTTEENTFNGQGGQILIAGLFGKVSEGAALILPSAIPMGSLPKKRYSIKVNSLMTQVWYQGSGLWWVFGRGDLLKRCGMTEQLLTSKDVQDLTGIKSRAILWRKSRDIGDRFECLVKTGHASQDGSYLKSNFG